MTIGMIVVVVCVVWVVLMVYVLLKRKNATNYFTPIPDAEVPPRHQQTLIKYRKLATEWGVPTTTAVCYRVRAGFTLKSHAPKAGPCYDKFSYLQNWNFPDEPTKGCLVFWIPRLAPGSTSKTRNEQIQLLGEIRQRMELPAHHLTNFGKVALDAGLILAHFKRTGERVPLDCYWTRTDTCVARTAVASTSATSTGTVSAAALGTSAGVGVAAWASSSWGWRNSEARSPKATKDTRSFRPVLVLSSARLWRGLSAPERSVT